MTTFGRDAKSPEPPWPFTGREDELELMRRSLAVGRPGVVVTGPAGHGRTRLAAEAVRGTDCARAAGTPETAGVSFAAFAHLLPEHVTLHRAVRLLSGLRLLWVDDAHLLDDASAAAVHQLAVQGRTRLLVTAADAPVPRAISRLWSDELLPRLTLGPLPREDTAQLLAAGTGGLLEPLTAHRLHRLGGGDLRLLRDLLAAVRDHGLLTRVPGTDAWAWRGPVPVTAAVREHAAAVLGRGCPDERETVDRLAFAEPLPLPATTLDLRVLERLEADGLVHVDDDTAVRLADPLHGPVLRAAAGRLRTLRLSASRPPHAPALAAEQAALSRRIEQADVRPLPAPVGEWLAGEGLPVPAAYAAVRARFARFQGALREAAAWAREGLRGSPQDPACRGELALATAQSGEALTTREVPDAPAALDSDREYDAVRLGTPEKAPALLSADPHRLPPLDRLFARHAQALTHADGAALDAVAEELERRGFLLFAAEAHAQAVRAHRDPRAARTARTRAVALARRCEGARTPALSGLVLGELTTRQRQIVGLAAAGLSNREIAERLTLSVRTVGNHLYGAYARLGANDRGDLPWLVELPEAQSA
ncbi:LuxR C-terminal-related transcriptional regulator [Streptomyces sp. NPDC018693]|uniref:LuxR family transcriptional regulator AbsR2 n=1 Tax=unclassified Streptomyces TaxID=2593676 RepID=UPI00378A2968